MPTPRITVNDDVRRWPGASMRTMCATRQSARRS